MTTDELEADALECWDLFRTACREEVRNSECMPSMEVLVFAYCAGAQMGRDTERDDCALLADGLGAKGAAEAIRAREGMDDEQEDADD